MPRPPDRHRRAAPRRRAVRRIRRPSRRFASSCTRAGSMRPWSVVWLPSGEMLVTERGGRAAHRPQRRARSAAGDRRARGARARAIGLVRRRAASAVREQPLRLFELQQADRRAAERARRRARRLERQRAHGRARHLRHAGHEQRVAARIRPRRQAVRQRRSATPATARRAEPHEPRRQGAAFERRRHACRATTRSSGRDGYKPEIYTLGHRSTLALDRSSRSRASCGRTRTARTAATRSTC